MIAIALSLVLAQSAANSSSRVTRVERVPGNRVVGGRKGSRAYAFFEFAPAGGAGMGAPCACTTPTGAKGEALTFTRASNATCTKTSTGGLATTGIANGDLVVCTNDQPRVEYDANGTLGLLVESSRTNNIVRSQELNNAAWIDSFSATAPTLNGADTIVAPDGTTTAEDYTFPATTAAVSYSSRAQTLVCPTATDTLSIYVKGESTSGTLDLCASNPTVTCGSCSFVTGSWSRCTLTTTITSGNNFYIGNMSQFSAASRPSQRVYLWGAQCEAGAYATSYIPTVAASVTRSAETALTSVSLSGVGSMAATLVPMQLNGANVLRATDDTALTVNGSAQAQLYVAAALKQTYTGATLSAGVSARLAGWWTGSDSYVSLNGAQSAAGTAASASFTDIGFERGSGGLYLSGPDGIISRVCIDPSPSRCR